MRRSSVGPLEFVQADVLARHRRLRGQPVRFLSGTNDHALKNVLAARDAGQPVAGRQHLPSTPGRSPDADG